MNQDELEEILTHTKRIFEILEAASERGVRIMALAVQLSDFVEALPEPVEQIDDEPGYTDYLEG